MGWLVLLGQTGKWPHLSIHWLASNTGTQSSPIRSDTIVQNIEQLYPICYHNTKCTKAIY